MYTTGREAHTAPVDLSVDAGRIDHDDHHESDDQSVSHIFHEHQQDQRSRYDDSLDQSLEFQKFP